MFRHRYKAHWKWMCFPLYCMKPAYLTLTTTSYMKIGDCPLIAHVLSEPLLTLHFGKSYKTVADSGRGIRSHSGTGDHYGIGGHSGTGPFRDRGSFLGSGHSRDRGSFRDRAIPWVGDHSGNRAIPRSGAIPGSGAIPPRLYSLTKKLAANKFEGYGGEV